MQRFIRILLNLGVTTYDPRMSPGWFQSWQRNADIGGHQGCDSRSAVRSAQSGPPVEPFLTVARNICLHNTSDYGA